LLFGGTVRHWLRHTVRRTVVGVLILAMITNGFDLLAVPDYWQNIVRGILIVGAVAIGTVIERR
jgi:ribose transport system permease protein